MHMLLSKESHGSFWAVLTTSVARLDSFTSSTVVHPLERELRRARPCL